MKTFFISLLLIPMFFAGFLSAQTGQILTASADQPGVQQHFLFNSRPANFFIYSHTTNPNGVADYITNNHNHDHTQEHTITGNLHRYGYALAPNLPPADETQIVNLYANMISAQGGTVYDSSLSGARMEVSLNGINYYVIVVPSGGGTQFDVLVMEYNPSQN